MNRFIVCTALLVAVACKKDPAPAPAPTARPASITEADLATADQLIAKLDALSAQVTAAGADCARATAAVHETAASASRLLAAMGELEERTRGDAAAEAWARTNYAPRVMKPLAAISGHACAKDEAYTAALRGLQPQS